MRRKNILFLGFGDLARRVAQRLPGHRLVGVARSSKPVAAGMELWQGTVDEGRTLSRIGQEDWDAVIVTLTPVGHSDDAYRTAYVQTLQALIPVWQVNPPGLIVWASSTGVYGQNDGSWVDEGSKTEPGAFSGARLLEAEALLQASGLPHCIVRLAGIYGPGRDYLIRQVRAGRGGGSDYTNRIHADDGAGFIAHLLNLHFEGQATQPLYLACDSDPAPGDQVRVWLAEQMGLDPAALVPGEAVRGGNKRCSNRRMLESGYRLLYASYRDGYGELLGKA